MTRDHSDQLIANLNRPSTQLQPQPEAQLDPPPAATRSVMEHHRDKSQMETPPMSPSHRPQPDPLPAGLPAPEDDGAAAHLRGCLLPPLTFTATTGEQLRLDTITTGRWVLYLYPLTGDPAMDVPHGWDDIPGARGCSQEACSFRDALSALRTAGAEKVVALSSDSATFQEDLVARLHLPYPMISDPDLHLARSLDLPTSTSESMPGAYGGELYKRLTLVIDANRIEHVFYPVFPPSTHADQVLAWLRANPAPASPGSKD